LLRALTLGAVINFPAEVPIGVNERYLRLKYTVGGQARPPARSSPASSLPVRPTRKE
jgi:hypothetical protein